MGYLLLCYLIFILLTLIYYEGLHGLLTVMLSYIYTTDTDILRGPPWFTYCYVILYLYY